MSETRVVVTGASGLLGWHARARLHAENCGARYAQDAEPWDVVALDRGGFQYDEALEAALQGADMVLHFAGANRGDPSEIREANPAIAHRLAAALERTGSRAVVVYANTIHADADTAYGRSKREAGEILGATRGGAVDVRLPHIFGEEARPFYNNVTGTFIQHAIDGTRPEIDPAGEVELLHAGTAVRRMIELGSDGSAGDSIRAAGRRIAVPELWDRVERFAREYADHRIPAFRDELDRELFNAFRFAAFPGDFPRRFAPRRDDRGTLYEILRVDGRSQAFFSTTRPGVTRGDHFHFRKVERFAVVSGRAVIRVRRVLGDEVHDFTLSGDEPAFVDMPTLCTHSIENVGDRELVTVFWSNEFFDPSDADTWADPVLEQESLPC